MRSAEITRLRSPVRFVLFGGVRIIRGGIEIDVTQPKQRALLALLLAGGVDRTPVRAIVDALWAGRPADTAVNQVHRHIGALRRLSEPRLGARETGRFIVGDRHGYRLVVGPDSSDVVDHRELVGRARTAESVGDRPGALEHYLRALALAGAPPGDDDVRDFPAVVAVEDERISAMIAAVDACATPGEYAAVLPVLRTAAGQHPFDESLQAGLMTALTRTGRPTEALHLYRATRRALQAELGSGPGPELERAQAVVFGLCDAPATVRAR